MSKITTKELTVEYARVMMSASIYNASPRQAENAFINMMKSTYNMNTVEGTKALHRVDAQSIKVLERAIKKTRQGYNNLVFSEPA